MTKIWWSRAMCLRKTLAATCPPIPPPKMTIVLPAMMVSSLHNWHNQHSAISRDTLSRMEGCLLLQRGMQAADFGHDGVHDLARRLLTMGQLIVRAEVHRRAIDDLDTSIYPWNLASSWKNLICYFNIDWNHFSRLRVIDHLA